MYYLDMARRRVGLYGKVRRIISRMSWVKPSHFQKEKEALPKHGHGSKTNVFSIKISGSNSSKRWNLNHPL